MKNDLSHDMIKRNLWEFQVEIDETATKKWYAVKEPWGCECGHCRNFLELSRHNDLPEPVHAIFKELCFCARQKLCGI